MKINKDGLTAIIVGSLALGLAAGIFFTSLFNNSRRIENKIETAGHMMKIYDLIVNDYDIGDIKYILKGYTQKNYNEAIDLFETSRHVESEGTKEKMFKDFVEIRSFLPNEGQLYDDVKGDTHIILPLDVPSIGR